MKVTKCSVAVHSHSLTMIFSLLDDLPSTLLYCVYSLQVFAYDYCFWSMDESQKDKFAGEYVAFVSLCFLLSLIWCILCFLTW